MSFVLFFLLWFGSGALLLLGIYIKYLFSKKHGGLTIAEASALVLFGPIALLAFVIQGVCYILDKYLFNNQDDFIKPKFKKTKIEKFSDN